MASKPLKILVLNAGSSSLKVCLYQLDHLSSQVSKPLWQAFVEWNHKVGFAEIKIKTSQGNVFEQEVAESTLSLELTQIVFNSLWQGETKVISQLAEIDVVGHRVVHGGIKYTESTLITPDVKAAIAELSILAPIHNPLNLTGIEAVSQAFGDIPQVAVFDTAFHRQMPQHVQVYPIPYAWYEQDIRRYGFHGISHQFVANRTAEILDKPLKDLKLVSCHLGNGASLAAIKDGHSIDTTMGFTPLEGLMMGSRSGSIDPSILIYLMRHHNFDIQQLEHMLNHDSGLKGIAGVSDMRQITEAIAAGNPLAQLAYDMYIHRLKAAIASMAASLEGIDALIFTAGIGENAANLRAEVCKSFSWLGLKINLDANNQKPVDRDIATADSSIRVLVIHTEEDWAIAQECFEHYQTLAK